MKGVMSVFSLSMVLFLLSSCSIEKRQFLSGYHVEWYGSGQRSEKEVSQIRDSKGQETQAEAPAKSGHDLERFGADDRPHPLKRQKDMVAKIDYQTKTIPSESLLNSRGFSAAVRDVPVSTLKGTSVLTGYVRHQRVSRSRGSGFNIPGLIAFVLTLFGFFTAGFTLPLAMLFGAWSMRKEEQGKDIGAWMGRVGYWVGIVGSFIAFLVFLLAGIFGYPEFLIAAMLIFLLILLARLIKP